MKNMRENYLALLRHEKPDFTPCFFTSNISCGFGATTGPWYEKGPNGNGLDGFGVRWSTTLEGGGAPTPAQNSAVLDDATEWETLTFPDLDAFDWEGVSAKELAGGNRNEQCVDFGMGNGVFERLLCLMGAENALCSFYEEPEATHDLLTAITDYKIRELEYIKKYYNPDVVTNYDDIATSTSLFLSPDLYREFIKPQHTRLHQAIIDIGAIPLFHCCGKVDTVIEDFIETGASGWTSAQVSNDLEGIMAKYGDRLAVIGGLDSTGPAGKLGATEADIRAEARRCITTYGKYDAYALFGPLLVSKDDPAKNGQAYGYLIDEYLHLVGII